MIFSEILTRFENVHGSGHQRTARCPAHEDGRNSLSVSEKSGKTVLHCHAGCSANQVCSAIGIELKDLFDSSIQTSGRKIVATYDYTDENGMPLFQSVRFEPKGFSQRHFENGSWAWGLNGQRRVLYRLPEIINAETIYIVEGEKDVDTLWDHGFSATCNPMGAGKWRSEYSEHFRDRTAIIIPDNDDPGRKHAENVAGQLHGIAKEVVIIELPTGKDVSEFFENGGTADDIIGMLERAESWQPRAGNKTSSESKTVPPGNTITPLKAVRLSDVESRDIRWLWRPFLAEGTFNLIEGEEGLGKTSLCCALATPIGSGFGLPGMSADEHVPASNVLFISAEDSLSYVLKPRLEAMGAACDRMIAIEEPFTLDQNGVLRLSLVMGTYQPKLVVIDPLFSYAGRINLNNDNEIRSITDELKRLAEKHECVIVGIRHIGKSKGFGDARNAGLNGIGWRAAARSVLLVGKNPENEAQKALCQTKNNLAPKFEKALGFEIRDGRFYWTGESPLSAESMLSFLRAESSEERSEKSDAMALLRETLRYAGKPAKDVQGEARGIGISEATLRRAKVALNIASRKDSFNGKWFWYLPDGEIEGVQEDVHEGA
jgi:hypothetical protein